MRIFTVIPFLFLLNQTASVINSFDKEQVAKALDLQRRWLAKGAGYDSAEAQASCDVVTQNMIRRGLDNSTMRFWDRHYSECIRHQQIAMCGAETKQDEFAIVPNSRICDGHQLSFANYKICALQPEVLRNTKPCVVISIGSNNLWQFEEDVHKNMNCEVHTFDPRERERHGGRWGGLITVPQPISDRTYFHNYAIGPRAKPEVKSITLEEIIKMSNITKSSPMEIFKIDCEGCEMFIFPTLAKQNLMHLLPEQIVMEFHVNNLKHWLLRKEIAHYVELFRVMFEAGYTVFENRLGDGGCEVSFIKISDKIDYHADQLPAVSPPPTSVKEIPSVASPVAKTASLESTSGSSERRPSRGAESAYRVLNKEANAIDAATLAKLVTDYGVQKPTDLTLLDKQHLEALAHQLKLVPRRKFLLALDIS
jgi:hypothetical protein